MDRTTLTANLKPLERRGLVKVAIDKDDKRSRRLTITAAGRALLRKAFPMWKQAHAEIERLITGISADALRTPCARCRDTHGVRRSTQLRSLRAACSLAAT